MNLKTTISALCVTLAVAGSALASPPHHHRGPPPPLPGGPACDLPSEVLALRQEIAAIKLDKLLDLTAAQASAILPLARQAQERKKVLDDEMKRREPALIAAMTAARDDLKRDGVVSEATAKKLRKARGKKDFRAIHEEFELMRAQVDAILTDAQREAFATFDPRPLSSDDRARHSKRRGHHADQHGGHHPPPPPPDGWQGGPPPFPPDGQMPPRPPPQMHRHKPGASMMLLSEEFIPFLEARMK